MDSKPMKQACDGCGRKISDWVAELGFTLGHGKKKYCRFCYLTLRNSGKLKARREDEEFLAAVNWELQLIETKKQRDAARQKGVCPQCSSSISFNLKDNTSAVGLCPGCSAHIRISRDGVKLVPDKTTIVLNVARRMKLRPDAVLKVYDCIVDEIAGRIAEQKVLGLPGLGAFVTASSATGPQVRFRPSKKLTRRLLDRANLTR
jgi:hypothetical protein